MANLTTARRSTQVDVHVGMRLRVRRAMLEMSQDELGKKLGVSFQQIQNYERGTNRMVVSDKNGWVSKDQI